MVLRRAATRCPKWAKLLLAYACELVVESEAKAQPKTLSLQKERISETWGYSNVSLRDIARLVWLGWGVPSSVKRCLKAYLDGDFTKFSVLQKQVSVEEYRLILDVMLGAYEYSYYLSLPGRRYIGLRRASFAANELKKIYNYDAILIEVFNEAKVPSEYSLHSRSDSEETSPFAAEFAALHVKHEIPDKFVASFCSTVAKPDDKGSFLRSAESLSEINISHDFRVRLIVPSTNEKDTARLEVIRKERDLLSNESSGDPVP